MIDKLDGLSSSTAVKGPCLVATTGNVSLSGEQTIDGVLTDESRVLVRAQTDGTENGIYVTSSGDWRRAADFSRNDDVREGSQVYVTDGTTGPGLWIVTTADPIVFDTSLIAFTRFSGSGTGESGEQTATTSPIVVAAGIRKLIIARSVAGDTAVTLPSVDDQGGVELDIVDWNGNAQAITCTPAAGETVMGLATVRFDSWGQGYGAAASNRLVPSVAKQGWYVVT